MQAHLLVYKCGSDLKGRGKHGVHVCRVRDPEETKWILQAVKEDLLENGTVIQSVLKLAGPVPSEHISPVEQVQNDWEEIEHQEHCDCQN